MYSGKSMLTGVIGGAVAALLVVMVQQGVDKLINPVKDEAPRPLEKYSFPALRQTNFPPGDIFIKDALDKDPDVLTYTFYFFDGTKKVSGVLNAPKVPGTYPVILMFRGYVDKEIYKPGVGTQRAAAFFAKNGYITLAPDFLGYGTSDGNALDSLESRFQTYTTALSLMASVENLDTALANIGANYKADTSNIAIWAHSNGGQIALSILEITGKKYPVTLWAPVTEAFPESILYFADEGADGGLYIRSIVADFVQTYNVRLYSPPQYIAWLKAPVLLHQGTLDEAVPLSWSEKFAALMKKHHKNITFYTYPGEDHNFAQGNWIRLINRDLAFFRTHLNL